MTSATPDRPRATRPRKNVSQPASDSAEQTSQAEDLAVPVSVDAGRDQDVDVDHPAALADLHRQRVRGHERVRARVQRPGAEVLDMGVELRGHHRDLRLRQPGDAEGLDQLLHPPGRDPEQVAGRHHRDQRPLGPPAPLEQPVREVGALAQLGDRDLHRAGPGVEVPGPVAVAGVDPLRDCARRRRRRRSRRPRPTSTPART